MIASEIYNLANTNSKYLNFLFIIEKCYFYGTYSVINHMKVVNLGKYFPS